MTWELTVTLIYDDYQEGLDTVAKLKKYKTFEALKVIDHRIRIHKPKEAIK